MAGRRRVRIGDHPFGQDEIGRDIFARVMRGTQTSLIVMVVIGVLAALIGVVIGAVAGYFRGGIDQFLMRFTDLFITFPVIVIGAVIGKLAGGRGVLAGRRAGLHHLDRAGPTGARGVPRPCASASSSTPRRWPVPATPDHPQAHPAQRDRRDHRQHDAAGSAILLETALSYLGFGIKAPDVSLGTMIRSTSRRSRPGRGCSGGPACSS